MNQNIVSDYFYCKNPNYTGCMKRCPCIIYRNCSYFTDTEKQRKRLQEKHKDDKAMKHVFEWYDIYYREHYNCQGDIANG